LTAYKRSNFAELLATALFPLLVWGGIRVGRGDFKSILPLSMVFGAIWITDLPAAVIASYSLAGLLFLSATFHRSLRPLCYGAVAILVGFGTIAFFLLPAAWERRWVSIGQALKFEWAPEHNFLFSHSNTAQYGTFNRGLSFFVLAVVLVTAIAALFTRQMRRNDPQDWRLLVALAAVSTFMMLPPSMILYRILPQLRFVEFPWRWLSPLCVVYAVLAASAMARNGKRWLLWAAAGCMVAAMGGVIVHTTWWDPGHRHMQELVASIPAGLENKGAIWASPLGSTPANLDKAAALVSSAESTSGNSTTALQINVERWSAEQKVFSIDAPRPLLVRLKLLNYPAWQGKVNGKSVHLETDQNTGQILLEVPGGLSHVEIRFGRTVDRTAGIVITAVTVLLFVPLTFWMGERKFKTEG
jgi:hypothetical protein